MVPILMSNFVISSIYSSDKISFASFNYSGATGNSSCSSCNSSGQYMPTSKKKPCDALSFLFNTMSVFLSVSLFYLKSSYDKYSIIALS